MTDFLDRVLRESTLPTSDRPCCKRFAPGRWCTRDDNHAGECDGPLRREMPAEELERGRAR